MRRSIIIIATMLLTVSAFAQGQFLEIDRCTVNYEQVTGFMGISKGVKISSQTICLSNGEVIKYKDGFKYWYRDGGCCPYDNRCMTDFIFGMDYPQGTLVYKSGNNYELVNLQKRGVLTIKKVSTHQVSSEFNASLNGDFSYRSFIVGRGSGSLRGSASGGTRTIVNVFFDNGTSATIEASKDPIWLDAEAGMKVEHSTYKSINIYKLL